MHGVSFDEAGTAFRDLLSQTIDHPLHSEDEERFVLIGRSMQRATSGCRPYGERGSSTYYQRQVATKRERFRYEENEE